MKKKIKKKKIDILNKERKSKKHNWLSVREVGVIGKGGYFDSEGVLHNELGNPQCTGVVGSTGKRCKNFAIAGELFCHIHGGTIARAKTGKMRIYSPFIEDASMKKLYEGILENKEIQGIQDELSLLRTLLASLVSDGIEDVTELRSVASTVAEIRKLVDSCTSTEVRLGQLIDIGKVTIIVKALANIIAKHVTDKEIIERIAHEFDQVIWPAPLASSPQPQRETPSREVQRISGEIS